MPDKVDEAIRTLATWDSDMGEDEDEDQEMPFMITTTAPVTANVTTTATKASTDTKATLGFDPTAKKATSYAKGAVGVGVSAATQITNATGGAAGMGALLAGASLSAGPIGLLIASAAMTVTSSATKAISAKKTHDHIKGLESIQLNAGSLVCEGHQTDHKFILEKSLPYIIAKKKKKRLRKLGGAVPIVGSSVETARSKIKGGIKWLKNSRGKNRLFHAEKIAGHHCSLDPCPLTTAIIAELFGISNEDAAAARSVRSDQLATVLSIKMKSV